MDSTGESRSCEFDLLKQIVLFAEEQAGQFATSVGFSITTNGTLLTDEKIHFLAQHEFSVLVSLDGDKKSHDRYRIFRNQNRPEKRIGSFDTVIKNMTRFVELYPEYLGHGIAVTLTATSDFQAIEQFVSKWEPSYPTIMANFVQAVPDDPRAGCGDRCIQLGRLRTVPCATVLVEENDFRRLMKIIIARRASVCWEATMGLRRRQLSATGRGTVFIVSNQTTTVSWLVYVASRIPAMRTS